MYLEPEIHIAPAENGGFVIKYQVKNKKKKGDTSEVYPRYIDKILIANGVDDLISKIKEIANKLPKGSEEEEFTEAFNE